MGLEMLVIFPILNTISAPRNTNAFAVERNVKLGIATLSLGLIFSNKDDISSASVQDLVRRAFLVPVNLMSCWWQRCVNGPLLRMFP